MKKAISILLVMFLFGAVSYAQLTTFTYPVETGQAFLSDKYDVFVKVGNGTEQKLQVLMSDVNYRTMYDGDWMKAENKDRTFSFVHIDYDKAASGLTFRVVKKFGNNSTSAVISPKSYGYTPNLTTGKELTFSMDDNQKYISINFVGSDNETPTKDWIKNMLCIFVDPPETGKPSKTGAGVVVYTKTTSATALANASTIYFPAGYHNLREYANGGLINSDGQITIKSGQSLYLEGGAFLEGIVKRTAYQDENQKVYGRGILTGRQYYWKNHPDFSGPEYGQIIEVGNNAEISGIMYMESPNHGLTGRKVHVKNVKFLGWHSNHDGIRVGGGSEVENTFARAVDDHFYNFDIHVHDCVLWAGHNGAILTYGWGGEQGSNNYQAGSSLLENIDIINPEWTSLGNNNGLIMSQVGYNHPISDYGTGVSKTVLRNIRMEGTIPGITNLKPRSSGTANVAVQVPTADVTYLGNLLLENISVENVFGKGLIRGEADPDSDGNKKWLVKDCEFKNITIGGVCVNETNKSQYFTIDANTIQNVTFTCATTNQKPVVSFTGPANNATFSAGSDVNVKVNAADPDGTISLVKLYLNDILMSRQLTAAPYEWAPIGLTNDVRLRKMNPGTYTLKTVAYDNTGDSTIATRSFTISAITGMEESVAIEEVKLFPNPSNSVFYIEQKGRFHYEILDLAGKTIEKGEAENKTTIGQNIEAGIYFVLISKEQNSFKLKIVKQ
jgi:hypothetical protein